MKLSQMDLFCWKATPTADGLYTKALDFGTDGNAPFEPTAGNAPADGTGGHHGDDVLYRMFWCLWCSTAAEGAGLTVVWETSDNDPADGQANADASKVELLTRTITAGEMAKGAYPIANEPLPKGLKRFNRLKIKATGNGTAPEVSAFLLDGRDEPIA